MRIRSAIRHGLLLWSEGWDAMIEPPPDYYGEALALASRKGMIESEQYAALSAELAELVEALSTELAELRAAQRPLSMSDVVREVEAWMRDLERRGLLRTR